MFFCGKYGHIKTACPLVKEAQNVRNEIETDPGQVLNVPENNDAAKVTSASAATDPSADIPTLPEIAEAEQLHSGCNADIIITDKPTFAKIPEAEQSGTNNRMEAIVEVEQD